MPKVRKIAPPPDDDRGSKQPNARNKPQVAAEEQWADEDFDDEDFDDEDFDDEEDGDDEDDEEFDDEVYEPEERGSWDFFPPSRPIRTEKGIKAKSQRGAFGESWWAKRWIAALERFGWGGRLTRGRSYARQGQVLSIDVAAGQVRARVQGSRPTPYAVTIELRALDTAQWARVISALAEQALFSAQLLAGEMPQDIEQVFEAASAPLFPQTERDISTTCSCPDYANPCKHIAAVHYLLGERFDEDPFLLFELRGRSGEQVIAALRARRAADAAEIADESVPGVEPAPALDTLLNEFYRAGAALETIQIDLAAPKVEATLLRRLGPPPGGAEQELRKVYQRMSLRAFERVLGPGND